jgi:hypothetical protein
MRTLLCSLLFAPVLAHAVYTVDPSDAIAVTATTSNLGTLSAINTAFGSSYTNLNLLYKGDSGLGGSESGTFSGSYSYSIFSSPGNDFDSFLIEYTGGPAASCPTCVLIVKDGNNDPSQYLLSLDDWNGTDTISGSGFWSETNGAISNVALWQGEGGGPDPQSVPEPAPAALLGLGLIGVALTRMKKRKA